MASTPTIDELAARVAVLEQLVLILGDRLLILAVHLGRLAERKEMRNVAHTAIDAR